MSIHIGKTKNKKPAIDIGKYIQSTIAIFLRDWGSWANKTKLWQSVKKERNCQRDDGHTHKSI